MSTTTTDTPGRNAEDPSPPGPAGPLGRLGAWTAGHFKQVLIGWLVVVAVLGAFAPQVTSVLSGAGWQSNGSESVQVRELAEKHFGGTGSSAIQVVVSSKSHQVGDPAVQRVIAEVTEELKADDRISEVAAPQAGASISRDGRTAVVLGGAAANTDDMVRAAEDLKEPLRKLSTDDVTVRATGSSVMWSDFNTANLEAMIHAEILSWPVTLAVLVVAFGSLVAAGLPLLLTMAGLAASVGSLVLISHVTPISIWAMDFALMFALALGIDYALFLVIRFRAALARSGDRRRAVQETMDTAGKAVLLSGLTVLVSLSAVMLVPAPAVRTMAVGIMLSVVFVLAATLTLLPAVLAKLGPNVNKWALPRTRADRTESPRFGAWGERLWRQPLRFGALALAVLIALAVPVFGLKTAMPSIKVVPEDDSSRQGYALVQESFGKGAPGMLQIAVPDARAAATVEALTSAEGIAGVLPAQQAADGSGWSLIQAVPSVDPSDPSLAKTVTTLRAELPAEALVGGAAVENLDLKQALDDKAPLVIGVILVLGFLLLLVALQAPLVAAIGVLTNLLATAAAFGVARLIFQDGHLSDLLGFEPQGFLDGWGPVFFFAMIFAIAMDYTVFLLSSAKENYERTGDPRQAVVGALAQSGRVVFAAAAVMVAVFFTFALADPLPPKEMGIVLGVAVLLDAFLIRLVLLPVLLRLTGRAAWWSPAWLRRVLPKIRFSHD
ncbi:MMPL family transporter [Streptomyces fulvoviolaceus]|uniref:MMPL family transporter n=1 Tax=Streptomyces fulvoviolaceus TaxID=285535 RepID=UPI0004C71632|nr:MMPL family transporter [Streptomyces fulvoviolaceus]MCT9076145.1 MMPL family transporter [Streptomyces fulvoviolaceus]